MAKFDPDEYLRSSNNFNPDEYLGIVSPDVPTDEMLSANVGQISPETTFAQKAVGAGEAALSALTGATSGTAGGIMNMLSTPSSAESASNKNAFMQNNPNLQYNEAEQKLLQGSDKFTYSPRTAKGQEYAAYLGDMAQEAGLQGLMGMPIGGRTLPKIPKNQALDTVKNQTLRAAQAEGYIIPPSTTNPSFLNRTLESISGKDATKQAVSIKNQQVTDNLTKRALGLSEDTQLTANTLNDYRSRQAAEGYDPIRKLDGEFVLPTVTKSAALKSATGKNVTTEFTPTILPADAIDKLSELRAKTNDAWNAYSKTSRGKKTAQNLAKETSDLENAIEANLRDRGLDYLIPQFKTARQNIAKSFTISNAIVEGSGSVNAQRIAAEFEKDAPLTGELATIGSFANTFPNATMNPKNIGSQGVSKMQFGLGSLMGGLGALSGGASTGGLAFAAPFVIPPLAKELILSSPYQNRFSIKQPRSPMIPNMQSSVQYAPYAGLLQPKDRQGNR
jgi:hypothetical protein